MEREAVTDVAFEPGTASEAMGDHLHGIHAHSALQVE